MTSTTNAVATDDFSRAVYCLLGIPIDNVSMSDVVERMFHAAATREQFFLSTPNLNFVVASQADANFRNSLLASDLCPVDGMGALLLCRILGLNIENRVAGSDIPAALSAGLKNGNANPYNIAFFGGEPGVAAKACDVLNAEPAKKLAGVCAVDPGKLSSDNMRNPDHIRVLNNSTADFLLVALGAPKGQAWIMANRDQLKIPAVSHLGATINFIAGTVKRAPAFFQKTGLEWLWRIKEEPKLAGRYYNDARQILALIVKRILPLGFWLRTGRKSYAATPLNVSVQDNTIILRGAATDQSLAPFKQACRDAARADTDIDVNLAALDFFDLHFAGLLLMLETSLARNGHNLRIISPNPKVGTALRLSGLGHLCSVARSN